MAQEFSFEEALGKPSAEPAPAQEFSFEEALGKAPAQTPAPAQAPGTTRGFDIGAMPEQFKSGVAGMQQAWFINAAKNVSSNLDVMNRIDRGEQVPDAQDPLGYQHMDSEQRAQVRAQFEAQMPKNVAKAVTYAAEQQGYVKNPSAERMIKQLNKKEWKSAWNTFTDDPAGIVQQLGVQSAPNALPSLIGGAAGVVLRGGIPAMMVGLGTGSFPVEYAASLVDSLQDAKVDLKDAEAVEAKLRDPKFLEDAGKKAVTRGTVIAAADALGGKFARPLQPKQLLKNIGRGAANIGMETGAEMGGELGAQVASGEKEIKWGDVIAEGLGAGPQALASTALATAGAQKTEEEPPPPRVEPTLDAEAFMRKESAKTLQQDEADEIEAITQHLIEQNIPADNARRIAEKRVAQARKDRITDLIAEPSDDPVHVRAKEHIDGGMDPVDAINRARVEVQAEQEADAVAQADTEGAQNVGQPIPPAGGAGPQMAGLPDQVAAPAGAGAPPTAGVVPAGPDVTAAAPREEQQPAPVAEALSAEDQRDQAYNELQTAQQNLEAAGYDATPEQHAELTAAEEKYKQADAAAKAAAEAPAAETPAAETPTETKPASKRGRKPVALTEEQKAQKEKTTKETNAANARVRRRIDRLAAELAESNLPVDETDIETPEALETAKQEKRAQRIAAVRELLTLAKQQGNSALGNRAKAILADRKLLSQQEYDLLKTGWQATQASKAARTSGALAKVNSGVKGTMTANQVLSQVAKTGSFFQRKIAGLLRKMLVGVDVHVIEKGDPIPEVLQNDPDWERARAVYLPPASNGGKREVYLRGASFGSHNGVNNVTILHELLHAALNRKVSAGLQAGRAGMDAPLAKFVDELQDLMALASAIYKGLERRGMAPAALKELVDATIVIDPQTGEASYEIFELPHEFLSYGLTESAMQGFMKQLPSQRGNVFSRFVKAVMGYLKLGPNDASAFTDLLSVTEDIAAADLEATPFGEEAEASYAKKKQPQQPPVPKATVIPSTEDEFGNPIRSAKKLARDVQVAQEKVRASREGETLSAIEQLFKARDEGQVMSVLKSLVVNKWQNMSHASVDKLVRLPTMTFMANWSGVKAIQDADQYMQQMVGMANSLTASAYEVRLMLAKELNPFFRSAKDFRTKFENLVYETTIARYDPSNPRNKVRNRHLDQLWSEIGDTGRRMYKGLQQHYENLIDLYSDLLDQQIENLQGLNPEAKQNLMAMLRSKFEAGARIKPYFPLVRYGDYWLRVTKGDFKGFYMFESVGDRNAFRQQLADEMHEDSEDEGIFDSGDTVRSLRHKTQANSQMLKEIFDALDKEGFNADDIEALKDSIYQIYLNTMPEQSFRDMFIHRKDRTGFSTDVLRNVSASASKMSMQLARLKYAPMLRNSVSAAYDATKNDSNLSPFAKETERRVGLALAGNSNEDVGGAIAGLANKVSYFWYLSSAASALIQPASIYIASLPVIGANHNDMIGAAKELGKMVTLINQYSVVKNHPDGTVSLAAPSLANNDNLTPREKEAVREMFQRGVSQSTYTSLLWGYKNLPTREASTVLGKAKELGAEAGNLAVGALMHNTERLTREATFLASYRLGYKQNLKKGMTEKVAHQTAINQAVNDVNEALANYDVTNRPRYMQQGIGKILFQFKMFPLHTALLLTTNFFKMLPVLNKEGKAAAAKKFFGIYLTAGSIAGAMGLPAFSPIIGVLAAALKSGDDDLPDELKDKDPDLWFREVFLPDLLGDKSLFGVPLDEIAARGPLDALTDLAVSSRIGLNDLFGRDTKEGKTAREGTVNWIMEHAGPSASLGLSIADAYDAYQLGDYQKAVDRLSPAVIRNILLAERMAREGIKDSKGNVVLTPDEAKAYALAQAAGFRPAAVARMGEINFKMTAIDQRIQNERNTLLGRMKVQARKQTDDGAEKLEKIFETEVARFNTKNPEYALKPDAIVKSLIEDLRTRASARLGFAVNEKNARLSDPVLYRMEQRLEKLREKETQQ